MRLFKFAIQLMVPQAQHANHFGFHLQEAVIRALKTAQSIALSRVSQFYQYYCGRGNIFVLIAKYPHCRHYLKALKEEYSYSVFNSSAIKRPIS